ncbi:AAA family ATPase [Sorangium sp. So ce388]|uniref:AAA family ATPase n=1 Tax=Sorangium sp. So ce388 TaxID=3133309 RepID=UPI003F5B3B83
MTAGLPRFVERSDQEIIPTTGLRGQYGPYIAPPALVHAARTALGLDMPLLLTGEPGCGKSDFAWVAAHALGWKAPLRCHVRSDTRARDLLYHYDAITRFGDAQHGDRERARDPRRYISLRPLGVALMSSGPRQVVLIDEIDKAPRDLPNDLLHELDEGRFEIPEIGDGTDGELPEHRTREGIALARSMERPEGQRRSLVIITSNAERQLPEPFLRRCVFYPIPPPSPERLAEIARARFPGSEPRLLGDLVAIFFALRRHPELAKLPTTAEMLNWITAITTLYEREDVRFPIAAFAAAVTTNGGGLPPGGGLSWGELPGLSCLLKQHEDVELVSPRAS